MGAGPEQQEATGRPPPRPRHHRQWLAALVANLAAVTAGTMIGWTAPTLPVMMGGEDLGGGWPAPGLVPQLSDGQDAWVTSLLLLAALAGALPAGLVANRWGLRRPLLALGVPFLLGWLLILLTAWAGVWLIYLGRAVHGLAVGATTVLVPRYCEEVAEVAVRGSLGALLDFSLCNGVLVAFALGLGLSYTAITLGCACVPLVFLAAFAFMPESPVYLARAGRQRRALAALAWLRPGRSDAELREELQEMMRGRGEPPPASPPDPRSEKGPTVENSNAAMSPSAAPSPFPVSPEPEDRSPPATSPQEESLPYVSPGSQEVEPPVREPSSTALASAGDSCPPPQARRRGSSAADSPRSAPSKVAASPSPSASPSLGRGLAGAKLLLRRTRFSRTEAKAVFVVYTLMFLQQAAAISAIVAYADTIFSDAKSALKPRYATFILGAMQSVTGAVAALCVERLGRRPLLLVSCLVVSACLVALAAAGPSLDWLPPVALWIYIGAFELGLGPLPWFITAELVGPAASGGAVALNWATAAIITYSFPKLKDAFGQSIVFAAYGVFGLVAAAFVWFAVPETRGKTRAQLSEEMQMWPLRPRKASRKLHTGPV